MALNKFEVNSGWKENGGAVVIVAHPDDEILIAWGAIKMLAEAGIPIAVLTLTLGELGETKDRPELLPEEMSKVRREEFRSSNAALGIQGHALDFPDTQLSIPGIAQRAKHDVLEFVRKQKFGVIFSFHPFEVTPEFDHPDHNAVGEITRYANTVSAVRNLHTDAAPMESRPALYLWTTNPGYATHSSLFTQEMEYDRKQHLARHYASQFPQNSIGKWGVIFDGITRGMNGNLPAQEMFMKVR